MKKNRNLILIAVLVLLIAGGIYFLFKDDNKGMHAASSQGPSIEFHNSDMKETKDGKLVWRFKAGHVTVSRDQNHPFHRQGLCGQEGWQGTHRRPVRGGPGNSEDYGQRTCKTGR